MVRFRRAAVKALWTACGNLVRSGALAVDKLRAEFKGNPLTGRALEPYTGRTRFRSRNRRHEQAITRFSDRTPKRRSRAGTGTTSTVAGQEPLRDLGRRWPRRPDLCKVIRFALDVGFAPLCRPPGSPDRGSQRHRSSDEPRARRRSGEVRNLRRKVDGNARST